MNKLDRRFPKFDNKLDPKAEREITLSLQRIYDTIDLQTDQLKALIKENADLQAQQLKQTGQLVNSLGTKLVGLEQTQANPIETLGSGTVTSVGLNGIASFITVSGSPINGAGSFSLTLNNQPANRIFAGPGTGAASIPTFRALVAADFPIDVLLSTNSKITAAAPYTNDGYIEVTINGVLVKLMTTA